MSVDVESIIPAVIFSKDYFRKYILTIRKMDGYWECSYYNSEGLPLLISGCVWYVYGNSIEEVLTKMWESIETDDGIIVDKDRVFVVV